MALDLANLNRVGSTAYKAGDARSKFFYATDDTVAACLASGYFNGATKKLKKGDTIEISAVNNGTPTCTLCVVTSASLAATVTTAAAIFA